MTKRARGRRNGASVTGRLAALGLDGMTASHLGKPRIVRAVHGRKKVVTDHGFEVELSRFIREKFAMNELLSLYNQFASGQDELSYLMRRAVWRSGARRFGNGVTIEPNVRFRHLDTFVIGDGVFVGDSAFIQGRFDGRCVLGNGVWIGPHSYIDARDLVIEDFVGWGPAAKLLGSTHTADPEDVPVIQSDLEIAPVRIRAWADIGTGAVIMPGVTVGKGSIVGAGAVVAANVPPFAVVAGVPAKFLRWRKGHGRPKLRLVPDG